MLNRFIEQHGSSQGGDFFLGEYTFAEIATTPFVQRGNVALLELRGYSIQEAIQQQKLTRLGAWFKVSSDWTLPEIRSDWHHVIDRGH